MRALLFPLLVAVASLSPGPLRDGPRGTGPAAFAQLSDSIPRIFLELVNESIAGRIEPARIRFAPPAELSLEDVRLFDADGSVVASVERAQINVALRPLLAGDLVISRLSLLGPSLDLHITREGTLNLVEALSLREKKRKEQNAGRFELRIEELLLEHGTLRYRQGDTFTFAAEELQGVAEVRFDRGVLVVEGRETSIQTALLDWPDASIPLSTLKARRWRIWNQRLDLERVEGSVAGSPAKVSGSLSWEDAGEYLLRGELRTPASLWPMKRVAAPFPLPPIDGRVTLTGALREPVVEIQATADSFIAFGYDIMGGDASVRITRESLSLLRGRFRLAQGDLSARGALAWDDLWLRLEGSMRHIPIAWFFGEVRPTFLVEGKVSGTFSLQGPAQRTPSPIAVATELSVTQFALPGVRSPSALDVEAVVELQQEWLRLESATIRGEGTTLQAAGEVEIPQRATRIDIQLSANQPAQWLPALAGNIVPKGLHVHGTVQSKGADWNLKGETALESCDAAGAPLRDVRADLDVTGMKISLSNLSGKALEGSLQGQLRARSLAPRQEGFDLDGQLRLMQGQLRSVTHSSLSAEDLRGSLSVDARIRGTLAAPQFEFDALGDGVTFRGERLGRVTAGGIVTRESLQLQRAAFASDAGKGELTKEGGLQWGDGPVDATFHVDEVQLARISALQSAALSGRAAGILTIGGKTSAPTVRISSHVEGLQWRTIPLGDGPLELTYAMADAMTAQHVRHAGEHAAVTPYPHDSVLTPERGAPSSRVEVSTRLVGPRGLFVARTAYDLTRRLVNLRLDVEETDLGLWLANEGERAPPLSGLLTGRVHLYGPLDRLSGKVAFTAPDIAFAALPKRAGEIDPDLGTDEPQKPSPEGRTPGAAGQLTAQLREGNLESLACLYTGDNTDVVGPCGGGETAWIRTQGAFDAVKGRFSLQNRAYVSESRLERWVPALRELQGRGTASGTAELRVERHDPAEGVVAEGIIRLQQLALQLPDAPRMSLEEPAVVVFANGGGRLSQPARFRVGEERASLEGELQQGQVRARLRGKLLLGLADIFTPDLSAATGTVVTDLLLEGPFEAPALSGSLAPAGPAMFELAALQEPIHWESGTLLLQAAATSGSEHRIQRVRAQQIVLRMREGNVRLDGQLDLGVDTSTDKDVSHGSSRSWSVNDFDFHVRGDSLPLQNARQRIEVSFDTRVQQRGSVAQLSGDVEVHSGLIRDRFSLIENFLLARPSAPPLPLEETLARVGLSDVELDLRLHIQELNYEADVMTYPLKAPVQGDLRVGQSLLHPAVEGALSVTGGQVTFPAAQFELTDSSIEFAPEEKGIDPTVAVNARAEFAPEITGCESDLPVLLTIQGRPSTAFELQLAAEDGTEHTRLELLMSALFRQRLSICEAERGIGDPSDAAVRAFTGQLLNQTLTADLEKSLRAAVGGDLQIKLFLDTNQVATDVRWQLGRRLALEGGAPLYQWNVVDKSEAQQLESSEIGNLRLRLLWLDHIPPFQGDLSFETTFSGRRDDVTGTMEPVTQGHIRYRAIEY